jgi:hypothetical protein
MKEILEQIKIRRKLLRYIKILKEYISENENYINLFNTKKIMSDSELKALKDFIEEIENDLFL